MFFLYFVCKPLPKIRKQHITAVSFEIFCLWLLIWKYYLIPTLCIDVNIVFLWVFWPIYRLPRCRETTHLILLGIIFSATKEFYNISSLFVIFQRPVHFPSTRSRFFIDGHNTKFNCIKGKTSLLNFRPQRGHWGNFTLYIALFNQFGYTTILRGSITSPPNASL